MGVLRYRLKLDDEPDDDDDLVVTEPDDDDDANDDPPRGDGGQDVIAAATAAAGATARGILEGIFGAAKPDDANDAGKGKGKPPTKSKGKPQDQDDDAPPAHRAHGRLDEDAHRRFHEQDQHNAEHARIRERDEAPVARPSGVLTKLLPGWRKSYGQG